MHLGCGPLDRDLAPLHDVDTIGDLQRLTNMLFDQQHTEAALIGRIAHRPEQPLDDQRGEAERELVGKEHRRLARPARAEREHLLLAAGEEPCSPAHQWLELGEQGRGVAHVARARGGGCRRWRAA